MAGPGTRNCRAPQGTAVPVERELRRWRLAAAADARPAEQAGRDATAGRTVQQAAAEEPAHRAGNRVQRAVDGPGHTADRAGGAGPGGGGAADRTGDGPGGGVD